MNTKRIIFILAILVGAAALVGAQETKAPAAQTTALASQPDRIVVPLSKPGQPARVTAEVLFGTVRAVGYEGKEIIVEAVPAEEGEFEKQKSTGMRVVVPRLPRAPRPVRERDRDAEQAEKDKTAGLKRIPLESSGLTAEEDNNTVTVRLESFRRGYDLNLRVPYSTSLKLSGANLDEIRVENVSGEVEVSCGNGDIKLKGVSGAVMANTRNGDIVAALTKVAPDKPMSFVTFIGDIDVTLPPDTKANLKINSSMGDVYSDFDIVLKPLQVKSEESPQKEGGKFKVSLERAALGTINGGGPEYSLRTQSGDIYVRKGK